MEIRPVLDERETCACQMSTENVPMLTACVRVRCARRTQIMRDATVGVLRNFLMSELLVALDVVHNTSCEIFESSPGFLPQYGREILGCRKITFVKMISGSRKTLPEITFAKVIFWHFSGGVVSQ